MSEFFNQLWQSLQTLFTSQLGVADIVDIIIVTLIVYALLRITRRTRAQQVIKGLCILLALAVLSSWLGLPTLKWMLSSVLEWFLIIIIIIFQPELRAALEQIGRTGIKSKKEADKSDIEASNKIVEEILRATQNLSHRKVGALMVFKRSSSLDDIKAKGTAIDATITSMLIENIFEPNTPLHDGAVIVEGGRIAAAGCFLPLSDNTRVDRKLGTRHRAALGISEVSDVIVLVVSEETGVISYARDGSLHRYVDMRSLRELLEQIYAPKKDNGILARTERYIRNLFSGKQNANKE